MLDIYYLKLDHFKNCAGMAHVGIARMSRYNGRNVSQEMQKTEGECDAHTYLVALV